MQKKNQNLDPNITKPFAREIMILKIERLWQFCLTFESWFCDLL
jgi:hypothetical protein